MSRRASEPPGEPDAPRDAEPRAAEPLWKRFVAGARDADRPDPPPPPVAPPRAPLPESGPADAALSADLDRVESRALIGTTDLARRAYFVADLFSGSEDDYRACLLAVAAAPTWTVAAEAIAAALRAHRANIYSEAAVALTDAAEARFRR